jgi:hypothetical protein
MVPGAQGLEIRLIVVIAGDLVIHLAGRLGAYAALGEGGLTPIAVPAEDADTARLPVMGKTGSSVRGAGTPGHEGLLGEGKTEPRRST